MYFYSTISVERYDATGLTFRDFVADHNGNGTTLATFLEAAGITGVATNMDVSTLPSTVLSSTQHVSAYVLLFFTRGIAAVARLLLLLL